MARQRFIHPSMWADKAFGSLKPDEKVLFIALFSLADDEGRLTGDAQVLRGQVFPYEDYTVKKVTALRDAVVAKMRNVRLYESDGEQFIALLKWGSYQRPQYAKPSKIPSPFHEASTNDDGTLHEASTIGFVLGLDLDRDGLGRAVNPSTTSRESSDEQPSDFEIPDKALRAIKGGAAAA